jgi:hypothetical protein
MHCAGVNAALKRWAGRHMVIAGTRVHRVA